MKVAFLGNSHLTETLRRAARIRGFAPFAGEADLAFIAEDILDHKDIERLDWATDRVTQFSIFGNIPIIVVSQVPPGWTRAWASQHPTRQIFYQVDTIIMNCAIERMVRPEQIIVGCADPSAPLPLAYQEYLLAFEAPVLKMSYESAELAKCAINYFLNAQIETTNALADAAAKIGADWNDVAAALRNDKRIGPHAYLRPGKPNQHLNRDVETVRDLAKHGWRRWHVDETSAFSALKG